MKKLNQKGSLEPVQILLIFLIIVVVGFVIFRVVGTKDEMVQLEQTINEIVKVEEPEETLDDSIADGTVIKEVDPVVSLTKVEDLDKLPDYTPDSFVEYMKEALSINDPVDGCIDIYNVIYISDLNVSGGAGSVNESTLEEGDGCGGGAKIVWYQKDDGSWGELGFQSTPSCDDVSSTNIYKEFIETCIPGDIDSTEEPIANPNGSIYDAL